MSRVRPVLISSLALAALVLVAGCGARSAGHDAIVDRCVAGGEDAEVCDCLGKQSAKRLDQGDFDLVVLGAKGEDEEADRRLAELAPGDQAKLSIAIREIAGACGVKGYLTGK